MLFLAAFTLSALLPILIKIIVIAVVFYILWWLIGYIGLPEPFNKVVRVLIAVVAAVYLIHLLLSFV